MASAERDGDREAGPGPAVPHRGSVLPWLLLLTLAALSLRLWKIGDWSFWEDEVFTLREVNRPLANLLDPQVNRYPLFPVLQKFFLPLLPGTGEGTYRLLAALLGALTVPALFLAGRSLVGRGPAMLAALFLALSPWHIYWSQNCRYYTLVCLLTLLSCWLFWRLLTHATGSTSLFLVLLPGALAILSHPSAAFVLAALMGHMVRELVAQRGPRGRRRRARAVQFLLLAALIGFSLWGLLHKSLTSYYAAKAPNPVFHLPMTLGFFVGVPLAAMAALSWLPLRSRARDEADFLFLLTLVPLGAVMLLGLMVRASAQYLFYTLPFFCLLAASGCHRLLAAGGVHACHRIAPLLLVLLPMAAQTGFYFTLEQGWRPHWREAARFVDSHRTDRDLVAVANSAPVDWYLNPIVAAFRPETPAAVVDLQSWDVERKVTWLLEERGAPRVWVILNPPIFAEKDPTGVQLGRLLAHFRLAASFPAGVGGKDLSLFVLVRETAAAEAPPAGGSR